MDIVGFSNNIDKHLIMHNAYSSKDRKLFSHELIFIEVLLKLEFINKQIIKEFVSYVRQFYPDYSWEFVTDDLCGMVIVEAKLYEYRILQKYKYGLEIDDKKINQAFTFGEMATNFCIKNLGYSLIGCGGVNTIITAQDNYEKIFLEYILKGYNIFKLRKLYYVNDNKDFLGYFREANSFPCHNNYNNNEYIEDRKNVFQKIY